MCRGECPISNYFHVSMVITVNTKNVADRHVKNIDINLERDIVSTNLKIIFNKVSLQ